MWNHQKGYMKEIPLAGGVLSLVGTFNPLELDGEERTLVFAVVDLLLAFERAQPHPAGADSKAVRAATPDAAAMNVGCNPETHQARLPGDRGPIYVASSWRNDRQPEVVERLRAAGHVVYDFRHPEDGDDGFHWSEIDPAWKSWTPPQFREALSHPIAVAGFGKDMQALSASSACVLVMPCGRSAHLELGHANGAGKPTAILLSDGEPELMYGMADLVTDSLDEIESWVAARIPWGLMAKTVRAEPTDG